MKKNKTAAAILVESYNENKYFYDRKKNKTVLCHPLLFFLLNLKEKGEDPGEWVQHLSEQTVELNGYGSFTRKDIEYYYKKYMLLKDNGYFDEIPQEERLSARLTADDVKRLLANTGVVTFEVTDRCCLECQYCSFGKFYDNYKIQKNRDMELPVAKRLLDYLADLWNSPLNLSHDRNIYIGFYGGEPLLNFSFIQNIVDYVKELKLLHNYFSFSMTTNGILLSQYMDFLAGCDFNLLISMDGDEANNQYRVFKNGKPAFKEIMDNIERLRTKYPDYFARKINFNAVLHNKNSVSQIFRFFKKRFNKHPSISELDTTGVKDDQKEAFRQTYTNINESLFNSEDYSTIEKEMFIELPNIQDVSTFLHKNNDFAFETYNDMMYSTEEKVGFPTGTCLPFSRKLFVTVDGKLLPCERIGHRHVLGQVTPQSVNIDYKMIAERYNSWFDRLKKQCTTCYNSDHCIQCVFHLESSSEHPVCNGFISKEDYSDFLSSRLSFIEKKPLMYKKILDDVLME